MEEQAGLEQTAEQVPKLRQVSVVKALLSLQAELLPQAIGQGGLEQTAAQVLGLLHTLRVNELVSAQSELSSHLIEQAAV